MQYVGETENALHIRMNGHWSDINTKKLEKPVAVMGIEKINEKITEQRKLSERYWIFELRMLMPKGLNIDD